MEGSEHSYTLSHLSSPSQDPGREHNSVTEHFLSTAPSGSMPSSRKKKRWNIIKMMISNLNFFNPQTTLFIGKG